MPEYIARAAFRSTDTTDGQDVVNVLHFICAQLSSPFDAHASADAIDTRLTTLYRAMMPTTGTLHDLTVVDVTAADPSPTSYTKSLELAGTRTVADSVMGGGICALIAEKTGIAKRYARGHMFCPTALNSASITTGLKLATGNAYYIACAAFATQLKAGWTASGTTFAACIYSRTRALSGLTPYYFPLTDAVVRPEAHWLRSRSGLAQ